MHYSVLSRETECFGAPQSLMLEPGILRRAAPDSFVQVVVFDHWHITLLHYTHLFPHLDQLH